MKEGSSGARRAHNLKAHKLKDLKIFRGEERGQNVKNDGETGDVLTHDRCP
jgi:hypothetical protein